VSQQFVNRVQPASVSAGVRKSNCRSWPKYEDLPWESVAAVWTRPRRDRSHCHWEATSCAECPAGSWLGTVWWV